MQSDPPAFSNVVPAYFILPSIAFPNIFPEAIAMTATSAIIKAISIMALPVCADFRRKPEVGFVLKILLVEAAPARIEANAGKPAEIPCTKPKTALRTTLTIRPDTDKKCCRSGGGWGIGDWTGQEAADLSSSDILQNTQIPLQPYEAAS